MKQKIKIKQNDNIIYYGRISDMPIKEEAILKKSIELFNDDDPCIIHQSYVIKEYVDRVINLFNQEQKTQLNASDFSDVFAFLNIEDIKDVIVILEG